MVSYEFLKKVLCLIRVIEQLPAFHSKTLIFQRNTPNAKRNTKQFTNFPYQQNSLKTHKTIDTENTQTIQPQTDNPQTS